MRKPVKSVLILVMALSKKTKVKEIKTHDGITCNLHLEKMLSESIADFVKQNPKGSQGDQALHDSLRIEELWNDYIIFGEEMKNAHKPSSHRSFDDVTHGRKRTKRDVPQNFLCVCEEDNCNGLEPFPELRRFVREEYDRIINMTITNVNSSRVYQSSKTLVALFSSFSSILYLMNQRILNR